MGWAGTRKSTHEPLPRCRWRWTVHNPLETAALEKNKEKSDAGEEYERTGRSGGLGDY